MKVLSILQPWASLIVSGEKRIETRSWNTKYRGPLLIHASKSKNMGMPKEMHNQFLLQMYFFVPSMTAFNDLPFGAIIGKVELIDTIPTDLALLYSGVKNEKDSWDFSPKEIAFGDYSDNRFGFLLGSPIKFENPVPAKGNLSFWEHPDL